MESSITVTTATTSNGTLDDLPYDVLQELFSFVSTRELISVWRLVSTKLSHLASELCRQRNVFLRLPRDHGIVSCPIGHLFSDLDNLPFSAAILTLDSTMPEGHAFSNYVRERFGEHLKSARISTRLHHYAAFFKTLRRTPNLVRLEILPESVGSEDPEEEDRIASESVELPKLKSLKMVYEQNSYFIQILETCFRDLAPQLDSIDLRLDPDFGIKDAEFTRCAELVSSQNFPKVSLLSLPLKPMYSDGWSILVAKGPFEIQALEVWSDDEVELVDMTSDLLVAFLANCHGLTSLTLEGFERSSLTSKRCRVPVLPALKKLELFETFNAREAGWPLGQLQFEPFKARCFPSLTEVVMDCYPYHDGNALSVIDVRQIFDVGDDATDRFSGVTSLDVGSIRSATNWAELFPNVTKLSAFLRNENQFATIFTDMTQVTEFDLRLNGIFFGLLQRIRSLQKLKTLTLRLDVLGDETAVFATLDPLNLKIVYNKYELGDYCLSLLRCRHVSVELLMKKDD